MKKSILERVRALELEGVYYTEALYLVNEYEQYVTVEKVDEKEKKVFDDLENAMMYIEKNDHNSTVIFMNETRVYV